MSISTVTSRNFARELANAKRATAAGPVIVTDRGRPTYALLKIEDYYRLAGTKPETLLTLMDAIPGGNFAFEPPKLGGNDLKPVDF